ncbi:MAG: GDP-L-fucose synthase [Desulfobacterales bacterium]|nr:GDP-L-fucose synthase [Desulfobacterales bacterium]
MEKSDKIYVAGHRGMVGSAILRKLKADGYTNIVTRTHAKLDLIRQDQVEAFFKSEKPDFVFLAAAKVGGIWSNNQYPAQFIYQNLAIQTNILQASFENRVEKLLFLGSACIYPKLCPQPIKEDYLLSDYLEPTNEPYAIAKIAGLKMCEAFNREYQTRYISVMPNNLYGTNDNFDLENSHVLPALIRKFHLAKLALSGDWNGIRKDEATFGPIPDDIKTAICLDPITNQPVNQSTNQPVTLIWGTGSPRREFLQVDDLADACIFLIQNYGDTEIINIGWGKDQTIRELAELISEVVGYSGKIEWDHTKPDGTPQKLLDVSRLTKLGWQPKIRLEDGIRQVYQWYLDNIG